VAARITLGEVVTIFDGPFDPLPGSESLALGQVFGSLKEQVARWFTDTTVADVIERERQKESVSFEI
jgi:DNA-binding IscR family transcriptional regulator